MVPYLRKYSHYLFRHRSAMAIGILCLLMTNVFGTVKPLILKFAIDDLEREFMWNRILYLSLAIVALAMVQGVFRFLQRRILIGASRKAEFHLRNDFVAHLQKLSQSYYDKNTTGDLMARASSDIDAVRMAYGPGVMYTIDTVVVSVFAITMMLTISWKMTMMAFVIFPLVSITVYIIGKQTHSRHTKAQETYSELNTFAQENLSGVRVVKAFALEDQHIKGFSEKAEEYLKRNMSLVKVQAVFIPFLYFLLGIGVLIVLVMGGRSIIQEQMSLGGFAAFMAYLMILAWPMIAVGWVVNIIQRAEASMQRIDKIFNTDPDISNADSPAMFDEENPKIEIRDLTFTYDDRGEVLKNINLEIDSGSSLGIVGSLGSGKSALVKLIARLYEPPADSLFIGNVPVEKIELDSLRKNIAFVPQDAFLFSDKIRDNITFDDDLKDEDLYFAAEMSDLLNDVREFPDEFETMVGERGITLSGGQKQRVTLARAILKDAPILILDDSLTAVDASTEAQILVNMKHVFSGKTVIVVSHRISAVSNLDKIIVMEEGRIVEQGCHDELIDLKGVYFRLYRKQLLEQELEDM